MQNADAIELTIVPRTRDLGNDVHVRRVLPAIERRMVGPFIFLDQMGPVHLSGGRGVDVRPHPHIGLATVTYLFEGALLHRDSLGTVQRIEPGAVNWMTAGAGIVHSERTPPEGRVEGAALHGLQLWVALPRADEELPPSFEHTPAAELPMLGDARSKLRLIAGELGGLRSPVPSRSPMFYVDVELQAGGEVVLEPEYEERALYVIEGAVELEGHAVPNANLLVLRRGASVRLRASAPTRLVMLGGEPMDGPRHIAWNFVSSSLERIRDAAQAWREDRFPRVPGETERIPLPDHLPMPADYP